VTPVPRQKQPQGGDDEAGVGGGVLVWQQINEVLIGKNFHFYNQKKSAKRIAKKNKEKTYLKFAHKINYTNYVKIKKKTESA
jgi:hypothetical protein